MAFKGVHCPGREVNSSPGALGIGLTQGMAISLPHQRERATLSIPRSSSTPYQRTLKSSPRLGLV
jgi:hypothetical protein